MTDSELLEAAAKAAALWQQLQWWEGKLIRATGNAYAIKEWNPLIDDGDALRLAVARRVDVAYIGAATIQARAGDGPIATEYVNTGGDHAAATRRAIVGAAAAMAT